VPDATGRSHEPLTVPAGGAGVVLLFVATECPISNGYAPEMNRIVDAYAVKGFTFYFVHGDPDVTPEQATKHAADFGYRRPVLMDGKHALVRAVGATVTPEAAVVSPGGNVVYLGRIDDLYVGFGKRRHEPTVRDLRDALDALLAGKPVSPPQGRAIGCTIPDAR
jgi:thiol-disulfide isomerase/thioredoxin